MLELSGWLLSAVLWSLKPLWVFKTFAYCALLLSTELQVDTGALEISTALDGWLCEMTLSGSLIFALHTERDSCFEFNSTF